MEQKTVCFGGLVRVVAVVRSNARILLANPAYSHLTPHVAQEGVSIARREVRVGARGRCPNLATWRFNWGSPTVSARFLRGMTAPAIVLESSLPATGTVLGVPLRFWAGEFVAPWDGRAGRRLRIHRVR